MSSVGRRVSSRLRREKQAEFQQTRLRVQSRGRSLNILRTLEPHRDRVRIRTHTHTHSRVRIYHMSGSLILYFQLPTTNNDDQIRALLSLAQLTEHRRAKRFPIYYLLCKLSIGDMRQECKSANRTEAQLAPTTSSVDCIQFLVALLVSKQQT